jgi:hypothetical protein
MDEAMRAQAVEGLSVGFASFVIDDVAATSQMPGPNGASRTVATYARRVATEGFTPGRLDTATVEDLKVTSDGAEILTAEAATLADIDIVAALRRILAGEAITPDTFNGLSIGRMDYTGLAYRPVGDVGGSMERLTLANLTFADGVRASLSLSILGLRGDAQAIAGLGVDPADLGIDDPAVDFGLDFAVDMAAKRASLRTLEFELRGLGRVEVSVELIDATQDLDPQTTKIEGARLRYVDSSLLERVLTLIGASPDEIADEVRNNGRALGNTPAAVAAVQAVVAFVLAPRSITLEMRPPRPPSLALLRATPPTALVATTGLRITANQ